MIMYSHPTAIIQWWICTIISQTVENLNIILKDALNNKLNYQLTFRSSQESIDAQSLDFIIIFNLNMISTLIGMI